MVSISDKVLFLFLRTLNDSERDKEKRKEEELHKEVFSADLTITFVLVTALLVSCSFGGWSLQRLEEEVCFPTCIEFFMG